MNIKMSEKMKTTVTMMTKKLMCSFTLTVIVASSLLNAFTAPVSAQTPEPPEAEVTPLVPLWMQAQILADPPHTTGDFVITHTVETGSGDNTFVYNGDTLTYTIVLQNTSNDIDITDITLIDNLPEPKGSLDSKSLTCNIPLASISTCDVITEGNEAPLPSGSTIMVTRTKELEWYIPYLAPGDIVTVAFSGQVLGKNEGDTLENYIPIEYTWAQGVVTQTTSREGEALAIAVRVRPQAAGGTSFSDGPVWFAGDWAGGTLTQDWADFDYDGDLDLALGSSLGTIVYSYEKIRDDGDEVDANDKWGFTRLWSNVPDNLKNIEDYQLSYGVAWAQLDPSSEYMQLIVVGDSEDNSSTAEGRNYIYDYQVVGGKGEFVIRNMFTTTHQLVRIVPGDFDGDGDIDLVGSTNWINATCPVKLYRNDGSNHFTDTLDALIDHDVECISEYATAALGAGDADGDGDLDLAIGLFPSGLKVLINDQLPGHPIANANPFTATNNITVENKLQYIPYDLKWGDYDKDGLMDLAAAYPLQQHVRIYRALGNGQTINGFQRLTRALYTKSFMTPLALDWGDFSGDGDIDLAVADFKPTIYTYDEEKQMFTSLEDLNHFLRGQAWSIRGIDVTNRHNLDIAITNMNGSSYIFSTLEPKLDAELTTFASQAGPQYDISLGNMNYHPKSDTNMDVVMGADDGHQYTFINVNNEGSFADLYEYTRGSSGPIMVAIGDINKDGRLDFAAGAEYAHTITRIGTGWNATPNWSDVTLEKSGSAYVSSLAWGDANDDRRLDLLVGYGKIVNLYRNTGTELSVTPSYTISGQTHVSSIAWADFNNDYFLDFAIGNKGGRARVYANFGDGTFDMVWQSDRVMNTTSVAWADYDNDGDPDLAVGNLGEYDYVWETEEVNGDYVLGATPAWTATTEFSRTRDVAWGDWDNDGYPDLAVAKEGQPDLVYGNINYIDAGLILQWQSANSYETTGVAWGDLDGDGDLDLAISEGNGHNGYYQNSLNSPAHLDNMRYSATPLPDNPTYVHVPRPSQTGDAYFIPSAELLGHISSNRIISVPYTLYDPEGTSVKSLSFEYSLNGGGIWKPASEATGSQIVTETNRDGVSGVFVWAPENESEKPISDNALFRVCYTPHSELGMGQHAKRCGISPPFRVRAIKCEWPRNEITASNLKPDPGDVVDFSARQYGDSTSTRWWDFGDGSPTETSMNVSHAFQEEKVYEVVFTAKSSSECLVPRDAVSRLIICVGRACLANKLYLPLVIRGATPTRQATTIVKEPTVSGELSAATPSSVPLRPYVLQTHTFIRQAATTIAANAGSRTRRITNYALGANSQPVANYDGTRVAFWSTGRFTGQNDDGNIEIFLADLQGDYIQYTQVTSSTGSILAGFNLAPAINAEGNRIAFFSDQDLVEGENLDHNFEIFLAEVDASSAITLVQVTKTTEGDNTFPSISADGNLIAFASDARLSSGAGETGYTGIFLAHIPEIITDPKAVTITYTTVVASGDGINDQPDLSADGKRIAFVSTQDLASAIGKDNADGTREIFLAEINGEDITYAQLTDSNDDVNETPSINADGTKIAFVGTQLRHVFLVTVTNTPLVSTSEVITEIIAQADGEYLFDQPHISDDGVRVAYIRESGDSRILEVYDQIEKRVLDMPTESNQDDAFPAISGDGKDVVYVSEWDVYRTTYPLSDLDVTKISDREELIKSNESINYTITVKNNGPSPASNVVLSDTVPGGLHIDLVKENDLNHTDDTESDFAAGTSQDIISGTGGFTISSYILDKPFEAQDSWFTPNSIFVLMHLDEANGAISFENTGSNSIDGSCQGTACPTAGSDGKITTGVFFDGVNDSISSGDYQFGSNNFTIALWVYPLGEGVRQSFVRKPAIQTQSSLLNLGLTETGQFFFTLGSYTLMGGSVTPGWQHLVVTGTTIAGGSTSVGLYRNGEFLGQAIFTGTLLSNILAGSSNNWVFGQSATGTPYYYGSLDEILMFTRTLTLDKIEQLYTRQSASAASYDKKGVFTSRVMTDAIGNGWRSITWQPNVPSGKELPDERNPENFYEERNLYWEMASNVLLMHMNDPQGVVSFLDASGNDNDAECELSVCPQPGFEGKFNTALHFTGRQRISIPADPTLTDLVYSTWSMWLRHTSTSAGVYLDKGEGFGIVVGSNSVLVQSQTPDGNTFRWSYSAPEPTLLNQWYHLAIVRSGGYMTYDVAIYVNGEMLPLDYSSTAELDRVPASDASIPLGITGRSGLQLDEFAIFNSALNQDSINDLYLRGATQIQFQVRACVNPDCSDDPDFVGPGNHFDTYYSELNNVWDPYPAFPVEVQPTEYFQYRAYMGAQADIISPWVISVTVDPQVECEYDSPVGSDPTDLSCMLSSEIAPLNIDDELQVIIPGAATSNLRPLEGDGDEEGYEISNIARVYSAESDHNLENDVDIATTTVKFVALKGVTVECPEYGRTEESIECCATTIPLKASDPITYWWNTTDAGSYGPTNDNCRSFTWTNSEAGEQWVTVTASNPHTAIPVSNDTSLQLEVPLTSVTLETSTPTELDSLTYFTATVVPDIATNPVYSWDFGDTLTDTGTSRYITHTYGNTGAFDARVVVTNHVSTVTDTKTVVVKITPVISLTKTAHPDPVTIGEVLTYTVRITNECQLTLTDLIMTDTLSAKVQHASGKTVLTETIGSLNPGATYVWTFPVTATATTILENFVEATTGQTPWGQSASASYLMTSTAHSCIIKNNNTQDLYNRLQTAVEEAGTGHTLLIAGECTDNENHGGTSGKEVAYITGGINLTIRGGYNVNFDIQNPALYPTTLTANDQGRIFYITGSGTNVTIEDMKIISGYLQYGDGAGIYIDDATVSLNNVQITGNIINGASDDYDGGGIYAYNAALTIQNSQISGNSVLKSGGGIRTNSSNLTIQNSQIFGNSSGEDGGGIYASNGTALTVQNGQISGNSASDDGAGIYFDSDADLTIQDSHIFSNESGDDAGGVYVIDGSATLTNTILDHNKAGGGSGNDGSAMRIYDAQVSIYHSTIAENTDGNAAIDAYEQSNDTVSILLYNSIIATQTLGIDQQSVNNNKIVLNGILRDNVSNLTSGGGVYVTNNIYPGSAHFVDPAAHDYHIRSTSDAIDTAVPAYAVASDYDGEPRPGAYADLGADEYAYVLQISKQAASEAIDPGELVQYTVMVTNTGSQSLHNVTAIDQPDYVRLGTLFYITNLSAGTTIADNSAPLNLLSGQTLASGQSVTIVYTNTSTVSPLSHTVQINNNATVTATENQVPVAATVTIDVDNVPPTANADVYTIDESSTTHNPFNIIGNDTDGNGNNSISLLNSDGEGDNGGTVTQVGNVVNFYPVNRSTSYTTVFTYTIEDDEHLTDSSNVTVKVTATNEAPTAINYMENTNEDIPMTFDFTCDANTDQDEDHTCNDLTWAISAVLPITQNIATIVGSTFRYTPTENYAGLTVFTYTLSDPMSANSTGLITVHVASVPDNAIAYDDNFLTYNEDIPENFNVRANDKDPEHGSSVNFLTVIAVGDPMSGTTQVGETSFITSPVGHVTYTPTNLSAPYQVRFSYTITNEVGSDTAEVTITVNANNDPPVATADSASTDEGTTSINIVVLDDDDDPDKDHTISLASVTQPSTGRGSTGISGDLIVFTPTNRTANYTANFNYSITSGGDSASAGVSVGVTCTNDAVTAENFSTTTVSETMVSIPIGPHVSDPDVNDNFSITGVTVPTGHGTSAIVGQTINFTPTDGFVGQTVLTYTVRDTVGTPTTSDSGLITITVTASAYYLIPDTSLYAEALPPGLRPSISDTYPSTLRNLSVKLISTWHTLAGKHPGLLH